jgi:hypothetical protein
MLLAGIAALPVIGPPPVPTTPDPILPLWQEWQAGTAQAEALCSEWSRLEQVLLRLVGAKHFEETVKAGSSEAGDLLEVERRQLDLDRSLDELVRRIIAQPTEARSGIAAKLALARELADPVERADPTWQLVEGALKDFATAKWWD